MKPAFLAFGLALALSTTACLEQSCDLIFIPALQVEVVDDQGNPIEDAVVMVSLDGGEPFECADDGIGVRACGGEGGDYAITAQAPGYEDASTMVTVDADACHPMTEDVELVLNPAP